MCKFFKQKIKLSFLVLSYYSSAFTTLNLNMIYRTHGWPKQYRSQVTKISGSDKIWVDENLDLAKVKAVVNFRPCYS